MACLRLFTFLPLLPLLSVPRLRLRIARSTSFEALREYRRAMVELRVGLSRVDPPAARLGSRRAAENNSQTLLFVPVRAWVTSVRCAPLVLSPANGTCMVHRIRIDRLLVERSLFESRAKAQAAIAAGRVSADGRVVERPSQEVSAEAVLRAEPAHPYVSRGGVKLAAALDHFAFDPIFDPRGRICLDVGASTGGFTQVLLGRGARRIYAVDVGRGQLDEGLRTRPEVISIEGTDIRLLPPAQLSEPPDFIVVDVSFVSLKLVLPAALALARTPACMLALIKPQFEAGRRLVKRGIVRDPHVHAAVCEEVAGFVRSRGWQVVGIVPSPIAGGEGNREFFIAARHS